MAVCLVTLTPHAASHLRSALQPCINSLPTQNAVPQSPTSYPAREECRKSRNNPRDAPLAHRVETPVPPARAAHHGRAAALSAERARLFAAGDHGSNGRVAREAGHCTSVRGKTAFRQTMKAEKETRESREEKRRGGLHSFTNDTPQASAVYLETYYPSAMHCKNVRGRISSQVETQKAPMTYSK